MADLLQLYIPEPPPALRTIVAVAAYEKEVGTVNAAEANRLRNNLLARVDLSKSRRPITDALNAAHMAAVATKGAVHARPPSGQPR